MIERRNSIVLVPMKKGTVPSPCTGFGFLIYLLDEFLKNVTTWAVEMIHSGKSLLCIQETLSSDPQYPSLKGRCGLACCNDSVQGSRASGQQMGRKV